MEVILEGQNFKFIESHGQEELGFRLDGLFFADPKIENTDGCYIHLAPGGRTPIFQVVDESSIFTDKPVAGKGTVIIQHPGLQPEFHAVDIEEIKDGVAVAPTFTYHPKTFFAWVADRKQGLGVFGTNTPPYSPEQERELDLDDHDVPTAFRELMLKVIERNSTPLQ